MAVLYRDDNNNCDVDQGRFRSTPSNDSAGRERSVPDRQENSFWVADRPQNIDGIADMNFVIDPSQDSDRIRIRSEADRIAERLLKTEADLERLRKQGDLIGESLRKQRMGDISNSTLLASIDTSPPSIHRSNSSGNVSSAEDKIIVSRRRSQDESTLPSYPITLPRARSPLLLRESLKGISTFEEKSESQNYNSNNNSRTYAEVPYARAAIVFQEEQSDSKQYPKQNSNTHHAEYGMSHIDKAQNSKNDLSHIVPLSLSEGRYKQVPFVSQSQEYETSTKASSSIASNAQMTSNQQSIEMPKAPIHFVSSTSEQMTKGEKSKKNTDLEKAKLSEVDCQELGLPPGTMWFDPKNKAQIKLITDQLKASKLEGLKATQSGDQENSSSIKSIAIEKGRAFPTGPISSKSYSENEIQSSFEVLCLPVGAPLHHIFGAYKRYAARAVSEAEKSGGDLRQLDIISASFKCCEAITLKNMENNIGNLTSIGEEDEENSFQNSPTQSKR